MRKKAILYAAIVFCGGASYGISVVVIKLFYAAGFTWKQSTFNQAFFALLLFGICCLAVLPLKTLQKVSPKQILQMMGVGATGCTTTLLYTFALSRLPIPPALTLLFQFAWMGLVVQMLVEHRPPHASEILAAVVIFIGTILGSGLLSSEYGALDPLGLLCSLASALCVTAFMFLNARVGVRVPWMERGFFVCLGATALAFCFCPDYFSSGSLEQGSWMLGIPQGLFGLFLPVLCFGIGTPHLSAGVSTIMASSELPSGVILSTCILGESVGWLQALGVVAVLSGIVISQLPHLAARLPRR